MRNIFLLTFIVFSNYFYAQKHITISTGDWNNPATWQNGDLPEYTFSDTVFINHRITFDTILSVHGYLRIDERGGMCGQHLLYVYNKMDVFGFFWVDSLDIFGGDLNQTSAYDCISTNGALIHGAWASFSVSNGESFRAGITFDCGNEFMTLSTLDIESLNKLSIYPNPTRDFIIIDAYQIDLDFQLFDFTGKTISSGKVIPKIDLSQLESGIYLLSVLRDGIVIQTEKIVKE